MYGYLHPADAPLFDRENLKRKVLIVYLFVCTRKVTFQFQQQTGQGVGVALDLFEFAVVDIQYLAEVRQQDFPFKKISVIVLLE